VVILNKIDIPDAKDLADIVRPEIEARGLPVFEVSTVSREGLRELTFKLAEVVREYRAAQPKKESTRIVLRPTAVDDQGFTVIEDPSVEGGFLVRGNRPERWIRQTDFSNDEAVGYLADRLHRLGVEDKLVKMGAVPGCQVTIGDLVFDWEPTTPAGIAMTMTGRGTDIRLERNDRIGAIERKAMKKARRLPGAGDEEDFDEE